MSKKHLVADRRKILQMTGTSIAAMATFTGSASGKKPIPVRTLKGSPNKPLKKKHIEGEREIITERLRSMDDPPDRVVFDGKPVPDRGTLAGYAISIQNGAPVERTYPIPGEDEPAPVIKPGSSKGKKSHESVINQSIQNRHGQIDKIRSSPKGKAIGLIAGNKRGRK